MARWYLQPRREHGRLQYDLCQRLYGLRRYFFRFCGCLGPTTSGYSSATCVPGQSAVGSWQELRERSQDAFWRVVVIFFLVRVGFRVCCGVFVCWLWYLCPCAPLFRVPDSRYCWAVSWFEGAMGVATKLPARVLGRQRRDHGGFLLTGRACVLF